MMTGPGTRVYTAMERFQLYDPAHCGTLGVLAALTVAFHRRAAAWPPQRRDRIAGFFGWLALANGVVWRVMLWFTNDFRPATDLPLHVCSLSTFALGLAVLTRNQFLYDLACYWILTGSTLALLIPELDAPFPHPRFFSLFLSHWIPLVIVLFLVFIQGWLPSRRGPYRSFAALLVYGLAVARPMNRWLGTNYLFTEADPDVRFFLMEWLPRPPFHLILIGGFFLCLFVLLDRALAIWSQTGATRLGRPVENHASRPDGHL